MVPYDAIIKLENVGEERELLSQSNLNQFVDPDDLPNWIHHTHGGSTPEHREEYFKDIPCYLIKQLTQHFLMDLEMFRYNTNEFTNICKK